MPWAEASTSGPEQTVLIGRSPLPAHHCPWHLSGELCEQVAVGGQACTGLTYKHILFVFPLWSPHV